MPKIHYHLALPGPRVRYIARHLLADMTGWEAEEVTDPEAFGLLEGPKLIYGPVGVEGAFHIHPEGLLERTGGQEQDPPPMDWQGLPVIYPTGPAHLPFDLFAAAFFHLSRIEEAGDIARDAHGRPVTGALHGARHGSLHRPLVDEWLIAMTVAWRKLDPRLPALGRNYRHCATLDVDNGAMYLGRPWWRSLGGMARDLINGKPKRLVDRMKTLTGLSPDPYQVHEAFVMMATGHGARAIINFLLAPRGTYDHAIGPGHGFVRACILAMDRNAEIGIHPGYHSSVTTGALQHEKAMLESIVAHPVTISRQHFLRMSLPKTYRELESCGIREEHSMGLADRTGFRAGTCTPFRWYDLDAEQETGLVVHPFAFMDSALAYGMGLSPDEALHEAMALVDAVKRVQGTLITVWHERFLSDYGNEAGWRRVAERVIQQARP